MPTALEVPTFRSTLVAGLEAQAGLNVQVTRRHPGPLAEAKGVWLGDTNTRLEVSAIKTGRQRYKGTTQLPVFVQTFRGGFSAQDIANVETEVWAMFNQVLDYIADTPTLSGAVEWNESIDIVEETAKFERSWAARLTASLTLHSRLT